MPSKRDTTLKFPVASPTALPYARMFAPASRTAMVLAVLAMAACSDSAEKMRKLPPDFSLTLAALFEEVLENKLTLQKLDDKYKGKVVEIAEAQLKYEPDLNSDKKTMTLILRPKGGGDYYHAYCNVAEDAVPDFGKSGVRDVLRLKGRFVEFDTKHDPYGVPTLKACVLMR